MHFRFLRPDEAVILMLALCLPAPDYTSGGPDASLTEDPADGGGAGAAMDN